MDWKRLDDAMNPVTVKELRQLIHGRQLLGLQVLLLLFLFFVASMIVLYSESPVFSSGIGCLFVSGGRSAGESGGSFLFVVTVLGMVACSLLVSGLQGMFRYATERENKEMDIGNFTPLSPVRLVLGRLWGALAVILYFLGLGLPVLVVAYHWGGLDLGYALRLVILALVGTGVLIQLLLTYGARGNRSGGAILLGVLVFFGMPVVLVLLGALRNSLDLVPVWLMECVFGLMALCLLVAENVGYLSPYHSNRYRGFRRLAMGFALVTLMLLWIWTRNQDVELACGCVWASYVAFLMLTVGFVGFSSLTGKDQAGIRLREDCPESRWGRFWQFLFANVWGGSLTLCWLSLILGVVVIKLLWRDFLTATNLQADVWLLNFFGYVLFYLELTQFIRQFCRSLTSFKAFLVLVIFCNGLPALIMLWSTLASDSDMFASVDLHQLWNVVMAPCLFYGLGRQGAEGARLWLGLSLALIGLLLVLPGIVRQFQGFKRPSQAEWDELLTEKKRREWQA